MAYVAGEWFSREAPARRTVDPVLSPESILFITFITQSDLYRAAFGRRSLGFLPTPSPLTLK